MTADPPSPSDETIANVRAYTRVAALRGELLSRFPNEFGGLTTKSPGDNMNFAILFVGDEREPIERYVEGVLAEIAAEEPNATNLPGVVYRSVPHSLRWLFDLKDRIWAERETLSPSRVINSAGIREDDNIVSVSTPNPSDVVPLQRALDAQFGSGCVRVRQAEFRLTSRPGVDRSAAAPPRP